MKSDEARVASIQSEQQPPVLLTLLKTLNASRKQIALYGADHPNAAFAADDLSGKLREFFEVFGRSTLVFTKAAALVNEHSYTSTTDSVELFHKVRSRGVMALTIVAPPPADQVAAFIGFLNADPIDVRDAGGASSYLRKHSVSLIAATDAVYTSGDGDDDDEDSTPPVAPNPEDMDRALGAAIEWLLKQDEEEDETPRLPIVEILSQPEEAAKLIREAVTKLHVSRRHETQGEIASEVVHDLKDLAVDEPDKWDNATPQIRKAMSKLPKGMRPEVAGFTEDEDGLESDHLTSNRQVADSFEVEAQIADVLADSLVPGYEGALPPPDSFSSLFGASPYGLLSQWRKELQPEMVMGSSGRTIETLMVQENRATEHERLARALAGLLPRAVEMKDFDSARAVVDALIRESKHGDPQVWRALNARSAVQSIDKAIVKQLIQAYLASTDPDAKRCACQLVEMLPELALQMIRLVSNKEIADIGQSLTRGISGYGAAAVGQLGRTLSEGSSAARELALDALIAINTAAAIREIGRALPGSDDAFTIRAITRLSTVRYPDVVDICTTLLTSRTGGVRCAALTALGEQAVPDTVPAIIRAASKRSMSQDDIEEKIVALEALSRIDSDEARDFLEKTARRSPLLGKRRYETIRATAERLLARKAA